MKPTYKLTVVVLLVQLQCMSCQKDDCGSYVSPSQPTAALIAKADPDQMVTLPVNYSPLDASQSTVMNGKITI